MLELYHWEPNGSHLKPLMALHEKGIAFESRYLDFGALEHLRDGMPFEPSLETRYNWDGEGPVLIHDGQQMTEALLTMEYLEDAFPETASLRPSDARGCADILRWQRAINERFMPAMAVLGCRAFLAPALAGKTANLAELTSGIALKPTREAWLRAAGDDYPATLVENATATIERVLRRMEEVLEHHEWLSGDAYSLADIDAFATARSIPVLDDVLPDLSGFPHVTGWMERIEVREGTIRALAHARSDDPRKAFLPGPEVARWG